MGSSDIEFALDLEDIAARAAKVDCIGTLACGRASFSYHRLPEPPLRLTYVMLRALLLVNADVRIARSASVWELMAAIQGVFVALYHDMENAVTWQHVWSHFCLCLKDEKMTDDKATLRAFGIKDGDEVCALSSSVIDSVVGLTFSLEAFSGASTGPGVD
ncbi:hypothetical protein ZWY2020_038650 [Hordeum vulgare]|nr:hypothetical protein ZWY2020_038650 [Hordeum vulgare]